MGFNGLHQLHAVVGIAKPLVDLDEGHDVLLFPQEGSGLLAVDGAVHGLFEQDGRDDLVAGKARTPDQPRAHLMDEVEHLLVAVVGVLLNPI
jgi:hypothetical protein